MVIRPRVGEAKRVVVVVVVVESLTMKRCIMRFLYYVLLTLRAILFVSHFFCVFQPCFNTYGIFSVLL